MKKLMIAALVMIFLPEISYCQYSELIGNRDIAIGADFTPKVVNNAAAYSFNLKDQPLTIKRNSSYRLTITTKSGEKFLDEVQADADPTSKNHSSVDQDLRTAHMTEGKLTSYTKCTGTRTIDRVIEGRNINHCVTITPTLCTKLNQLYSFYGQNELMKLKKEADACRSLAYKIEAAVRPPEDNFIKEESNNINRLENISKEISPNSFKRTSMGGLLNSNDGYFKIERRTSMIFSFGGVNDAETVMDQASRASDLCDDLAKQMIGVPSSADAAATKPGSK